jgi:hypothetical protein
VTDDTRGAGFPAYGRPGYGLAQCVACRAELASGASWGNGCTMVIESQSKGVFNKKWVAIVAVAAAALGGGFLAGLALWFMGRSKSASPDDYEPM